jgi:hypothetical protein
VQVAREGRRVLSGERDAQRVGRARRLARGQHAADRRLASGSLALKREAATRDARALGAQPPALGLERGERAIGLGDGALGAAQRVARLAPAALFFLQVPLQRVDAAAQGIEVRLPRRLGLGAERRAARRREEEADQALAFPCAATAAMRLAISSASPR